MAVIQWNGVTICSVHWKKTHNRHLKRKLPVMIFDFKPLQEYEIRHIFIKSFWPSTHIGLVTLYGNIDLGEKWWHQAITWTNVAWSLVKSRDIHLRDFNKTYLSHQSLRLAWKWHLKFHSNLPGASELLILGNCASNKVPYIKKGYPKPYELENHQVQMLYQGPLLLTWLNFNPSMDK